MSRKSHALSVILPDADVKTIDSSLKKEFGFGIFPFALTLAINIWDYPGIFSDELWKIRNVLPQRTRIIREELENLNLIQKRIITILKSLNTHLNKTGYWNHINGISDFKYEGIKYPNFFSAVRDDKGELNRELSTKAIYGLSEIFNRIRDEQVFYEAYDGVTLRPTNPPKSSVFKDILYQQTIIKRGKPIQSSTVIAAVWSGIIKTGTNIQWPTMETLFSWFAKKLDGTTYRDKIAVRESGARREEAARYLLNRYKEPLKRFRDLYFNKNAPSENPWNFQITFTNKAPRLVCVNEKLIKGKYRAIIFPDGASHSMNIFEPNNIPKRTLSTTNPTLPHK